MYTYKEITGQAEQLKTTFDIVQNQTFKEYDTDMTLFIGCGTSFYLAHSAARYFQEVTGGFAASLPASEVFLHPETSFVKNKKYRVIAISRSGTTSEVLEALKTIKNMKNVMTIAVTCSSTNEMAELADEVIALDHVIEKSVVMTQSFTNMLYALQLYSVKLADSKADLLELSQIPELVEQLLVEQDEIKKVGDHLAFTRFMYLGSGIYNGLAKEATLKLKEMTQTECESYSNLELRHGPISIVDEKTVVVLISQSKTNQLEASLVKDIQQLGGSVLGLLPEGHTIGENFTISIPGELSDRNRLVLYMPQLQLLAYYRAVRLGYNPDEPRNLTQVVKLSL